MQITVSKVGDNYIAPSLGTGVYDFFGIGTFRTSEGVIQGVPASFKEGTYQVEPVITKAPSGPITGSYIASQSDIYVDNDVSVKGLIAAKANAIDVEAINHNLNSEILPPLDQARANLGQPSVLEAALIESEMNNKLWFHPPELVSFEESEDGIGYAPKTVSDSIKKQLFSGKSTANVNFNKDSYLRINIDAGAEYVHINNFYMYMSTGGDNVYFKIEAKNDANGSWELISGWSNAIQSWPGHVFIRHNTIRLSPNSAHHNHVRLTIKSDPQTSGNEFVYIEQINWYGGYPASKRTIYDWDYNKNVYFPNDVFFDDGKSLNSKAEHETGIWTPEFVAQGPVSDYFPVNVISATYEIIGDNILLLFDAEIMFTDDASDSSPIIMGGLPISPREKTLQGWLRINRTSDEKQVSVSLNYDDSAWGLVVFKGVQWSEGVMSADNSTTWSTFEGDWDTWYRLTGQVWYKKEA